MTIFDGTEESGSEKALSSLSLLVLDTFCFQAQLSSATTRLLLLNRSLFWKRATLLLTLF